MNVLNIYSSKVSVLISMKHIRLSRKHENNQLLYTYRNLGNVFSQYRQQGPNDFFIYLIPLSDYTFEERPMRLKEAIKVCEFALDMLADEDEILKERLQFIHNKYLNDGNII